MIISVLKNIGEATLGNKTELDVILDGEKLKFKKGESVLECIIDFNSMDFELANKKFDLDDFNLYLPGIENGSTINNSLFFKIKHMLNANEKGFNKLTPEKMINFKKMMKISDYEEHFGEEIPKLFCEWIENKKLEVAKKVYDYFEKNHLEDNKGKLVIRKHAPSYLAFVFKNGSKTYPGQLESFRKIYVLQKNSGKKYRTNLPEIACISCGNKTNQLENLQTSKYFDLFSIDQEFFRFHFNEDTYQAMICRDCDIKVRQGYLVLNSILKFRAYTLKVSEKKNEYIDHCILPLITSKDKMVEFIDSIRDFREDFYDNKKITQRRLLGELQEELEIAVEKDISELRKKIEKITERNDRLENGGMLDGSKNLSMKELLKCVTSRDIAFIDLYFSEKNEKGVIKKIVKDIVIGNKSRMKQIIRWLEETDNQFNHKVKFEFGYLNDVFGVKTARLIHRSLFNNKTISKSLLISSAYENAWSLFRDMSITKRKEEVKWKNTRNCELIHYTMALMKRAQILE